MSSSLTCVDRPEPGGHVFTELYPGWKPDDATPCDCLAVSWAQERKARLRLATERGLAREAQKRHEGRAPRGPDVTVCDTCGSRMSSPTRGRRGQWVRVCTSPTCRYATHTTEAPPHLEERGPIAFARRGDLPFASMESIARRPLDDVHAEAYRDAKQRQVGSDE